MNPMGRRTTPPATWLLATMTRLLDPAAVAMVVRPAVADLQHELRDAASALGRFAVAVRHAPGLAHILLSAPVGGPWHRALGHPVVQVLRWAALLPLAVCATYAMQRGGMAVAFVVSGLLGLSTAGEFSWKLKPFLTVCMAGAFVGMVWWVAPARKRVAASAALFVSTAWSGVFLVGAFARIGEGLFNEYLAFMGAFGMLGGAATWLLAERRARLDRQATWPGLDRIDKEEP